MITGMGDELQTMKKGIIELADAIVINKADGANKAKAERTAVDVKQALHLFSQKTITQKTAVLTCSAKEAMGISEIGLLLENFKKEALIQGSWQEKRAKNSQQCLFRTLNFRLQKDFYAHAYIQKNIKKIENEVAKGNFSPQAAANLLLENYKIKK